MSLQSYESKSGEVNAGAKRALFGLRVLLVEHDRELAAMLRARLEQAGCAVHLCFDGGTGLRHATQQAFDILLVDVELPVLDGFEITKRLRLLGLHIPIVLLSESAEAQDELRGFDSGADDYVLKPLQFELLVARLRARTRASSHGNLSKLRFADLMLDAEKRKVTRAGRELDLTRTEFSVLKQLMCSGGKVAQRSRLIETIWPDKFVSENNLDTFVRYLRQKVDPPGLPRLIHTERGVGYYLRDSHASGRDFVDTSMAFTGKNNISD